MPEVSVILPTMDRWPLLSRALASVLAQEDVELEVIVIDDGSSDGTPARLGRNRRSAASRPLPANQPGGCPRSKPRHRRSARGVGRVPR